MAGLSVGYQETLAVLLDPHCDVEIALTVADVLRAVRARAPDLAVVDISRGGDALSLLYSIRSNASNCLIALLASREQEFNTRTLVSLDATAVFNRAVSVAELVARLDTLLVMHPPRGRLQVELNRHVSTAVDMISERYRDGMTVEALAGAVRLSTSHFAHLFGAQTGKTVKEYVTRVRIEVAKRLLRETDDKLQSIARAVGMFDASHLSRVFSRYVHCRPSAYRRHSRSA